jgi:archaellum component FlaC
MEKSKQKTKRKIREIIYPITTCFIYFSSVILVIFGLTGIAGISLVYMRLDVVYGYVGALYNYINSVSTQLDSISTQFMSVSGNITEIKERKIITGEIQKEIEKIRRNLNSIEFHTKDTASRFRELRDAFDICILGVCPFAKVTNLLDSLANTADSASSTIGQASNSLIRIENMTVKDILTQEQLSMLDSYSDQFSSYGKLLTSYRDQLSSYADLIKQYDWTIPYILGYIATFYGAFILSGICITILTRRINRLFRKLETFES